MLPIVRNSPAGTGVSKPVILDTFIAPANILLGIKMNGATATVKVQYSFDDPEAVYATDYNTNASWLDHPEMTGISADSADNLSVPARAVRLNTTAWTSGVPTLTVIQAGIV